MHPDEPYFIILLCLTPDDFTHQGESAATQWVKNCEGYSVVYKRLRQAPQTPRFIAGKLK
jgi:hypothetical protein